MKKLIFKLILVSIMPIMVLLLSCCHSSTNKTNSKQRIIIKEYTVCNGAGYHIIEVDGYEYLSQYNGGICPLVLDSNTQNK